MTPAQGVKDVELGIVNPGRPPIPPVDTSAGGHPPPKKKKKKKNISAALASTSPYHTRNGLLLEHGQQGGHGDPRPGCENVVPGIVTPGGSPSPPPIDPLVKRVSKIFFNLDSCI